MITLDVDHGPAHVLRRITADVTAGSPAIAAAEVRDGAVLVTVPHTTAGVTINENADPSGAQRPGDGARPRLVPDDLPFTHREGNSDAHAKASSSAAA